MNAWDVVHPVLLGIVIVAVFWPIGNWILLMIVRECRARARADTLDAACLLPKPPPVDTRPPPGCAVVQQPCDALSLARVV